MLNSTSTSINFLVYSYCLQVEKEQSLKIVNIKSTKAWDTIKESFKFYVPRLKTTATRAFHNNMGAIHFGVLYPLVVNWWYRPIETKKNDLHSRNC